MDGNGIVGEALVKEIFQHKPYNKKSLWDIISVGVYMIKIIDGKLYLNQVKKLIQEYTQWLKCDSSFQNLDKKLADIAEKYAVSNGELMVLDTIGPL